MKLDNNIISSSEKYLHKLRGCEMRMRRKLSLRMMIMIILMLMLIIRIIIMEKVNENMNRILYYRNIENTKNYHIIIYYLGDHYLLLIYATITLIYDLSTPANTPNIL